MRRAALALLLLTFLLAGCGGDDVQESNAYVDNVNLAQSRFASSFERLARDITSSSTPAEDRKTLRSINATLATTVADLRKIKAPEKVRAQHDQLVEALAEYEEAVGAAQGKLGGSAEQATAAEARLAADTARTSTRVTAAITAINQKLQE
ncbi:MAG TPA: hypothetical protein PKD63_03165 [Solirubrobacteraceae bacterium]|nr:hypothetical protein [Solirubrobacteraceae bacterium]